MRNPLGSRNGTRLTRAQRDSSILSPGVGCRIKLRPIERVFRVGGKGPERCGRAEEKLVGRSHGKTGHTCLNNLTGLAIVLKIVANVGETCGKSRV